MKKQLLFLAVAAMLTSCGGGIVQKKSLLKDLPVIAEELTKTSNDLEAKLENIKSEEEAAKIIEEAVKLEAEYEEKINKAGEALVGQEIPVEVSEGLGVKVDAPLTVSEAKFSNDVIKVVLSGQGELTEEGTYAFKDDGKLKLHDVSAFVVGEDNKPIYASGTIKFEKYADVYPVGSVFSIEVPIKLDNYNFKELGKLEKIVLTLKDSENYKAAKDFNSELKKAYKEAEKK
ncbi:MAG: hypothetical protein IJ816_03235 [Alloprevotella sp.]|nr:hypothetical protein [Alloprevotella sp.]